MELQVTKENNPASITLAAGPLSMIFEPGNAMLRYVRLGELELVRAIFVAVRDQDWNTIPCTLHDLLVSQTHDEFTLSFVAKCSQGKVYFDWLGQILGNRQGQVRFSFQGLAKSTFLRNRIGLCVLHPIKECAGLPCVVEHVDGATTNGTFPIWIAPHQPFKNIRAIKHEVTSGLQVRVAFEGEVFEMEDQRNWTDASFKTYGTPLDLPFPVEIAEGSRVEQSVAVELLGSLPAHGNPSSVSTKGDAPIYLQIDWQHALPLPPIGLSMATCGSAATPAITHRLRDIQLSHLRVDVRLNGDDWSQKLEQALELSGLIETRLEVALFTSSVDNAAWQSCMQQLHPHLKRIARWLVFHSTDKTTPDQLAMEASKSLRGYAPEIPVVVGTNHYFAELNRNRPGMPSGCLVAYSMNPQVHAFDNLSLCETLQAYPWTVDSAWQTFGKPVVVSPITLRPRFNPNATSTTDGDREVEPESDSRQSSGFAAAWTVGVLAQLAAHTKVASLTLFETFGPRGILGLSGEAFAMTAVFEAVGECVAIFASRCSAPLDVAAVALAGRDDVRRLLLANMSKKRRRLSAHDVDGRVQHWDIEAESVQIIRLERSP